METVALILVGCVVQLSIANITYDVVVDMINRGAKGLAKRGYPEEWIAEQVAEQREGLFLICMFWPITFIVILLVYGIAYADANDL